MYELKRDFRRAIWPEWDKVARSLPGNHYGAYEIAEDELAAIVNLDIGEVEEMLDFIGFEFNAIAALKIFRGEKDAGSWRRIGGEVQEDDIRDDYTRVDLPSMEDEYQWHVHPFVFDDKVLLTAHHEIRWEAWAPHWDLERSRMHYRGSRYYYSPREGVEMVQSLLDYYNIEYIDPADEVDSEDEDDEEDEEEQEDG